jgi:hypothetical protein
MKELITKLLDHPLTIIALTVSVVALTDIAVCANERRKYNKSCKNETNYYGFEYRGLFIKQTLPAKKFMIKAKVPGLDSK